jgi:hypothetical protein
MAETLRIFVGATRDSGSGARRHRQGDRRAAGAGRRSRFAARRRCCRPTRRVFERVANCDRVYFLLGNDITAPAGLEWATAWRLERSVLPLRSQRAGPRPRPRSFSACRRCRGSISHTATDLARIVARGCRPAAQTPWQPLRADRARSWSGWKAYQPAAGQSTAGDVGQRTGRRWRRRGADRQPAPRRRTELVQHGLK